MAEDNFAHHFSMANIPFGIASSPQHPKRSAVTRIEDDVIFLDALHSTGLFAAAEDVTIEMFQQVG